MPRRTRRHRSGATTVECAVIFPVFLLLAVGLIVGVWAVFCYQQVASLTREAARYASVRGERFARNTGGQVATPESVYNEIIRPRMIGLDPAKLTYQVTWNTDKNPGNLVTVRVDYQWLPPYVLGGVRLSSTAVTEMEY